MDPERDGFFVELTFVKTLGRGGKNKGKRGNPGKMAWEKLENNKHCIVRIKTKDDLCCARATVTMKEGWIRERRLHRQANVPKGPCGFEELQKFQDIMSIMKHPIGLVS